MSTKAQLKAVRDLQHRKERAEQGRFLVQGPKLVAELLGSAWHTEAVYATSEAADVMHLPDAIVLPAHELERIGTLESGNSVVAVVRLPLRAPIATMAPNELILALDGINDPGNLGTVLRIADWFGVRRVLCSPQSVDAFSPKCVQASMGAIFRVEVQYAELAPRLAELRSSGAALQIASMEGRSVFKASLSRPAVLVLGSESHGVSDAVRELGGDLISVPRVGGAESLNLAMAAAALCMEYTRQDLG